MNELKISILTPKDWERYKCVRLESLNDSPDSFGSTFGEEAALSESEWQSRLDLKSRGLDALPLIAEINGQAVGLAWGVIHAPDREVVHIYQMWVSPASRGKGIAQALLSEIKAWALGHGCNLLALAVTTSNKAAVSLYRSSGFMTKGQPVQLRVGSALRMQPMVMELHCDNMVRA